jgi:phosphoglycerate dehydrogenase-like enzyme
MTEPVQIVVADNYPPFFDGPDAPELQPLRAIGDLKVHSTKSADRSEFLSRLEPATVLIYLRRPWPLDEEAFDRAKSLRLVSFPGAGTDSIDLAAAKRHGVMVANLPGANAPAVAEHTIGLLFAAARSIPRADRIMRDGRWEKFEGFELNGKILGVIGLGAIGREVARLGKALGMKVIAWSHTKDEDRAGRAGIELVDFDELFRQADVVSVHLRLTPDSAGLIGNEQLTLMRRGSVFLNTARSALVDQAALLQGLRTGQIAALGVDVYPSEPVTAESNPYWGMDNVVMTPHMADETWETNARMRHLVVENVVRFFNGTPTNVVA